MRPLVAIALTDLLLRATEYIPNYKLIWRIYFLFYSCSRFPQILQNIGGTYLYILIGYLIKYSRCISACMYVRMYVCMHVCTRMYVYGLCMYECMYLCMYVVAL
jgi:hypothetical protein